MPHWSLNSVSFTWALSRGTYSTRERTFTSASRVARWVNTRVHHVEYSKTHCVWLLYPVNVLQRRSNFAFSHPERRQTHAGTWRRQSLQRQLFLPPTPSLLGFSVHSFLSSELPEEGRGGCVRFWLLGDVPGIHIRLPATWTWLHVRHSTVRLPALLRFILTHRKYINLFCCTTKH